jgi:hypothetical protein
MPRGSKPLTPLSVESPPSTDAISHFRSHIVVVQMILKLRSGCRNNETQTWPSLLTACHRESSLSLCVFDVQLHKQLGSIVRKS